MKWIPGVSLSTLLLVAGCGPAPSVNAPAAPVSPSSTLYFGERVDGVDWPALDDRPQAVAPNLLAKNYMLVLDASGSMDEVGCSDGLPKIDVAKRAAVEFARAVPSDANLGLITFDQEGVRTVLSLAPVNMQRFEAAIGSIAAAGGTPLASSMVEAYRGLEDQARAQLGNGEYHLVVLTDGEASRSENPYRLVNDVGRASPVIVHAIGFCIGADHALNQPGLTLYAAANDPSALSKGLSDVLAESPSFDAASFQ